VHRWEIRVTATGARCTPLRAIAIDVPQHKRA
jgi:hypothetical protein